MIASEAPLSRTFDAHSSLRQATHETHLRLHGLPQFAAIAERRLDRGDYAKLLGALRTYHTAIARAAAFGGLSRLSSSPRRLDLLDADLAALGVPRDAPRPLVPTFSPKGLYGALYVSEGSALGGRVIARQLDYLLGDAPEGRSFFRGDAGTSNSWRAFLAALVTECSEPGDADELIAGAVESFTLFERCVGQ